MALIRWYLLNGKEVLNWLWVLECWLLDFADIMLRTVLWVSTSFLIISSFVQRFFFRTDIFSSKDFSRWVGRLLLTCLFKSSEKESIFLFKRANMTTRKRTFWQNIQWSLRPKHLHWLLEKKDAIPHCMYSVSSLGWRLQRNVYMKFWLPDNMVLFF